MAAKYLKRVSKESKLCIYSSMNSFIHKSLPNPYKCHSLIRGKEGSVVSRAALEAGAQGGLRRPISGGLAPWVRNLAGD